MDDGRYGLDSTFQGASGYERATWHEDELREVGARYSFRKELEGGWASPSTPSLVVLLSRGSRRVDGTGGDRATA
jgi:hypothetical protein